MWVREGVDWIVKGNASAVLLVQSHCSNTEELTLAVAGLGVPCPRGLATGNIRALAFAGLRTPLQGGSAKSY